MAEEQQLKAGVNTHENVIFTCYGGASNTGITSGLAALEAVKELGLKKAAIMCLAGLPTNVKTVLGKTRATKKKPLNLLKSLFTNVFYIPSRAG